MPRIPDLIDPRYLNEVGWFLYREKYGYNHFTESYTKERVVWSKMLLEEFLHCCNQDQKWLENKTAVTVGCGCTGDLAMWPAAVKIAIDPLLYTYQKLSMLVEDVPSTSRTIYLSVGVEDMPLLDEFADILLCRNALDHMPDPKEALKQIWRVLKDNGVFYLSVDVGGTPTPDEPSPFTMESLYALLQEDFKILSLSGNHTPFNQDKDYSIWVLASKKQRCTLALSKDKILQAYEASINQERQSDLK